MKDLSNTLLFQLLFLLLGSATLFAQEESAVPFCSDEEPQPSWIICSDTEFILDFADTGTSLIDIGKFEEGEEIELIVKVFAAEERINMWSYGLEHDPEFLELKDFSREGTEVVELVNEFCLPLMSRAYDVPGFIASYIAFVFPCWREGLPHQSTTSVLNVTYKVIKDPGIVGTQLRFAQSFKSSEFAPPVTTVLTAGSRNVIPRFLTPARITSSETPFIRGDANTDGTVDISDTAFMLEYLFVSGEPTSCWDAFDADRNFKLEITDPIRVFQALFVGEPLPGPFPECGLDEERSLGCLQSIGCEL